MGAACQPLLASSHASPKCATTHPAVQGGWVGSVQTGWRRGRHCVCMRVCVHQTLRRSARYLSWPLPPPPPRPRPPPPPPPTLGGRMLVQPAHRAGVGQRDQGGDGAASGRAAAGLWPGRLGGGGAAAGRQRAHVGADPRAAGLAHLLGAQPRWVGPMRRVLECCHLSLMHMCRASGTTNQPTGPRDA